MELMKHVNSTIMLRGFFPPADLSDRIGWITVEKWKSATGTANEVTPHVYKCNRPGRTRTVNRPFIPDLDLRHRFEFCAIHCNPTDHHGRLLNCQRENI